MWLSVLADRGYPRIRRGTRELLSSIGDPGNPDMSQKPSSRSPASRRCSRRRSRGDDPVPGYGRGMWFERQPGSAGDLGDRYPGRPAAQRRSDPPGAGDEPIGYGRRCHDPPRERSPSRGTRGQYRGRTGSGSTPARAFRPRRSKGQTERTRRPMVERLPDIYNVRTELRADVTARGAESFPVRAAFRRGQDST